MDSLESRARENFITVTHLDAHWHRRTRRVLLTYLWLKPDAMASLAFTPMKDEGVRNLSQKCRAVRYQDGGLMEFSHHRTKVEQECYLSMKILSESASSLPSWFLPEIEFLCPLPSVRDYSLSAEIDDFFPSTAFSQSVLLQKQRWN